MIDIIIAFNAIFWGVACGTLYARVRGLKRSVKMREDDIRYWIGQRDHWRNLAERIANRKTIAEHEQQRLN